MAASKGLSSINNNWNSIIPLDKLLTISNIDHANIIIFIICFKILKLISLVILLVYFYLLSIWKRTTKRCLMIPTNTLIVEVITSLGEYKAYSSAITALAKNQKCLQ
jgi:hypothetical protein